MSESDTRLARSRLLRRSVTLGAWFASFALAVPAAAIWLLPSGMHTGGVRFWFDAALFVIRTGGWHLGLAGIVAAVVIVAMKRWGAAGVALGSALLLMLPTVRFDGRGNGERIAGASFTVAVYNVLAMNRDDREVLASIDDLDADVLFVFEHTRRWERDVAVTLTPTHPHSHAAWWSDRFGVAVYSRVPIRSVREIAVPEEIWNRCILRVEIEHEGRLLAVYGLHPAHPVTPRRLRSAWHLWAALFESLANERLPAVVMGDFNATDVSPQLAELRRRGFRSAFAQAGHGRGATYSQRGLRRHLPGVRIDHVFIHRSMAVAAARLGRAGGSDHLPVVAELGWREPARVEGVGTLRR